MTFDYSWVEWVRHRPGMYIGPMDQRAVINLLADLVDTALIDHRDPPCRNVQLRVTHENRIAVHIDGGVISPQGIGANLSDLPAEVLITALASVFHRPDEHKIAPLALMSACAERLIIELDAGGISYRQSFVRGHPDTLVTVLGPTDQFGLRVTWEPDKAVIPDWAAITVSPLMGLLRVRAALHPGLVCEVQDERTSAFLRIAYPDGLAGYLVDQVTTDPWVHAEKPLAITGEWEGVRVTVALLWHSWTEQPGIASFANGRGTVAGGSHVRGFWRGLADGMTTYAQSAQLFTAHTPRLRRKTFAHSCQGAVAVWMEWPSYGAATRSMLNDRRAERAVRQIMAIKLPELIQTERPDLDRWLRHYATRALDEEDEDVPGLSEGL